jgi:drug/metabolite transporter (DMT)-like permease
MSSFLCEAAYSVAGKGIVERYSVMKMIGISLLVGTAINLAIDGPATLASARHLDAGAWALLAVMAVVCTVIGYTVWFIVIKECPVNVVALTLFSQAIFGTFVAAVWVGEQLHWGQFFGSLTIVAGLILGLSRQIAPPASAREAVLPRASAPQPDPNSTS